MDTFKKITLEEQTVFTDIFNAARPIASEFTFPYLYMWRRDYNFSYAIVEDYLCLISRSKVYPAYGFCPIPVNGVHDKSKFKRALETIEAYFSANNLSLRYARIAENHLPYFKEAYGESIRTESLDNTSDYVYHASDLITLAGKKFSKKRNHINQFIKLYGEYEYAPIGENNLDECKKILDEWADRHEIDCDPDNSERVACNELFENWSRFPLKGALIKVNGKFQAFTIGEVLNPETAVVRIEKGNVDIHGIYAIINREFCTNEWSDMKYINREEDMGVEGLRKSKLSYNPAFMVNKFLVKV